MLNGLAFPSRDGLTIGFAHVAYRAAAEFAARRTGVPHFEVRTLEELERLAHEADVLVVSGLWRNTLMASTPKLRFVQSFSAGTDQFDKALFMKRGIRLASAQGANERAVAEHAIGLILALTRQLHLARDNQRARRWPLTFSWTISSACFAAKPYCETRWCDGRPLSQSALRGRLRNRKKG